MPAGFVTGTVGLGAGLVPVGLVVGRVVGLVVVGFVPGFEVGFVVMGLVTGFVIEGLVTIGFFPGLLTGLVTGVTGFTFEGSKPGTLAIGGNLFAVGAVGCSFLKLAEPSEAVSGREYVLRYLPTL